MVIVGDHIILKAESCIVISEPRFWGDMGENGKDEFVREFENCEMGEGWSTFN